MNFLKFLPVLKERVWGGQSFKLRLGRSGLGDKIIGESWEVCDRDDVQSAVAEGEFANMTLSELLKIRGCEIMGANWDASRRFPIMIKWLDCRQRLSLQVHPSAAAVAELGGESKSEAWYFLNCDPRAKYVAGLKSGCDVDSLMSGIKNFSIEKNVKFFDSRAGDFVMIECGCVHSIGAGNLVLEIQQNSDTTYRIYDWNRPDINGSMRALHIPQSRISIDPAVVPTPVATSSEGTQILCEKECFKISKINLAAGETVSFAAGIPHLLSMLKGGLVSDGGCIGSFETALLPACESFAFKSAVDTSLLVTENF